MKNFLSKLKKIWNPDFLTVAYSVIAAIAIIIGVFLSCTSCTVMLMSQKTPQGSTQTATVSTSADSTHVTLKPSF